MFVVINPYQTPPNQGEEKKITSHPFHWSSGMRLQKDSMSCESQRDFRWIIRVALGHVVAMSEVLPIERWLNTVSWYQSSQYLRCRYTCIFKYIYIYAEILYEIIEDLDLLYCCFRSRSSRTVGWIYGRMADLPNHIAVGQPWWHDGSCFWSARVQLELMLSKKWNHVVCIPTMAFLQEWVILTHTLKVHNVQYVVYWCLLVIGP